MGAHREQMVDIALGPKGTFRKGNVGALTRRVAPERVVSAVSARREGITRARVTQVMSLLHLAPNTKEHILALSDTGRCPAITERALRRIVRSDNYIEQRRAFSVLINSDGVADPS